MQHFNVSRIWYNTYFHYSLVILVSLLQCKIEEDQGNVRDQTFTFTELYSSSDMAMTFGTIVSKVTKGHNLLITLYIDVNKFCPEIWILLHQASTLFVQHNHILLKHYVCDLAPWNHPIQQTALSKVTYMSIL